jgi:hypothetical protein
MKQKIRLVIAIIFISFLPFCIFANGSNTAHVGEMFDYPPEPYLISPISDRVILTGKDSLEFKWLNDRIDIDHYEFRLYKGYNMYGPDLIYKENPPKNASSIKIKAGLFQDGQVYSWSLIQVAISGRKSDKSFSSFKVIKK